MTHISHPSGLHPDRIIGRHRDYLDTRGDPLPRLRPGPRKGAPGRLHVQPEADRVGNDTVRSRQRRVLPVGRGPECRRLGTLQPALAFPFIVSGRWADLGKLHPAVPRKVPASSTVSPRLPQAGMGLHTTYTYNGDLQSSTDSAILAPASCIMVWPGYGQNATDRSRVTKPDFDVFGRHPAVRLPAPEQRRQLLRRRQRQRWDGPLAVLVDTPFTISGSMGMATTSFTLTATSSGSR